MRKLMIAAILAGAVIPTTQAMASTAPSTAVNDPDNHCALTAKQFSQGFLCLVDQTSTPIHREIAQNGNIKCQNGTLVSTTYYSVNKGGNVMETRTAEINAEFGSEDAEWYGPPAPGPCA